MNICFFIGRLVEEVEFCFTMQKDITSISKLKMQLTNKSILNIYAFDKQADFCYKKLEKNSLILVQGCLTKNSKGVMSCVADKIYKL